MTVHGNAIRVIASGSVALMLAEMHLSFVISTGSCTSSYLGILLLLNII